MTYATLIQEFRLANNCGVGAGGFQHGNTCARGDGGAAAAPRATGRRSPERLARMLELQRQIKRERNLPQERAQLTPEQLHHVRRLATRRETDENTRRQAAGQPARPAPQQPAADNSYAARVGRASRARAGEKQSVAIPEAEVRRAAQPENRPVAPTPQPPPAPPSIPAGHYPRTTRYRNEIQAAITTGDIAKVRAVVVPNGVRTSMRNWHQAVIQHMERQGAVSPQPAAAPAPAETPVPFRPFAVPAARELTAAERDAVAELERRRVAIQQQKDVLRERAEADTRAISERHAPALSAAETRLAEAAEARRVADAAFRAAESARDAATRAREAEIVPVRRAANAAIEAQRVQGSQVRAEKNSASAGVHRKTLKDKDGKVLYKPSDFAPTKPIGWNVERHTSSAEIEDNKTTIASTLGVRPEAVVGKIKEIAAGMVNDLPTKIGQVEGKWTTSATPMGSGGFALEFKHPGMVDGISRYFTNGPAGLTVEHGYFNAGASKGDGISQLLFRQSLGVYEKLGVKQIKVHAAMSHGGYVWLRHGFVPDETDAARLRTKAVETLERLRTQGANLTSDRRHTPPTGRTPNEYGIYNPKKDRIPAPGTKIPQAVYDALLPLAQSDNPRDLLRLAEATYGDVKIGAEMFVGTNWYGKIDMKSGDLDRTKAYVMRNRNAKS